MKSIYEVLPTTDLEDLRLDYIDPKIYKRDLPKLPIDFKKEFKGNKSKIIKLIKKLEDICNYKAFDKKSLNNQINKLKDVYVKWVIIVTEDYRGPSYIGPQNVRLLNSLLIELNVYWTKENVYDYLCRIIQTLNLRNKDDEFSINMNIDYLNEAFLFVFNKLRKIPSTTITVLLQYLPKQIRQNAKNNLKSNDYFAVFHTITFNLTKTLDNNEIRNMYCSLIQSIPLTDKHRDSKRIIFLSAISKMNQHGSIKKQVIDDILFDTVKNNRAKICKYLYKEFTDWLEDN